jgi:hypothetical protein
VRLDGDEAAADADDGDPSHFSGTYMSGGSDAGHFSVTFRRRT